MDSTTTMESEASVQVQLQVRFITRQKKYVVTDAPILVPARLKRVGLSEIINHLLGLGGLFFISI